MSPPALPGILWHVTLLIAGTPAPLERLRHALEELCARDPHNMGARYQNDQVELQFWDEGAQLQEVAVLAAGLWRENQQDVGLPDWSLVGLEVMDSDQWRQHQVNGHSAIPPGLVALVD